MGYTTEFEGHFTVTPEVDQKTYELLVGLNKSRRMKRDVDPKYGIEGEFYTRDVDIMKHKKPVTVIDSNQPPWTQPGLWMHWLIKEDHKTIVWDGGEKFYSYKHWMFYLINRILKPRGHMVNGKVRYQGEDVVDSGVISISKNDVFVVCGKDHHYLVLRDRQIKTKRTAVTRLWKMWCEGVRTVKKTPVEDLKDMIIGIQFSHHLPIATVTKPVLFYNIDSINGSTLLLREMERNKKYEVDYSFLEGELVQLLSKDQYIIKKLEPPKINEGETDSSP